MDIDRLRELAGTQTEAYQPKYYTNDDAKEVRQLVAAHLGYLRKNQKYAQPISDYILDNDLDMNQEQLEGYIEDILAGEFWYPGKESPFPGGVMEDDAVGSGRGDYEDLADEVMFVTSQLYDMAEEFNNKGMPNRAAMISKLAKRLQAATGDQ